MQPLFVLFSLKTAAERSVGVDPGRIGLFTVSVSLEDEKDCKLLGLVLWRKADVGKLGTIDVFKNIHLNLQYVDFRPSADVFFSL